MVGKNILILGAGKSATHLIKYVLEQSVQYNWKVVVADIDLDLVNQKIDGYSNATAVTINVTDANELASYVEQADVVASLLPAKFHPLVATACLAKKAHLITASYVSKETKAMDSDFKKAGLLFMGEIGLDPGIDHLAMMKMIDELHAEKATIKGVYSYTGALVHPEDDNNPWHYKFTWAPMNVVRAGQGISRYLYEGNTRYIPYNRIFTSYQDRDIAGLGSFEIYPNRDSIKYLEKYHLSGVDNFIRGTIRRGGYCDAWNCFVLLGWTDDTYQIDCEGKTYAQLLRDYIPLKNLKGKSLEAAAADFWQIEMTSPIMDQMRWLGIFDAIPVNKSQASPAQVLCDLLAEKWKLEKGDRDMIVMLHEIEYEKDGKPFKIVSEMCVFGDDEEMTGISKTVGLPAGIALKLLATDQITLRGVHIPTDPSVYKPILKELEEHGVKLEETVIAL
ncbi:saccharopine dehydrogenase NADP-binding domain-containing protein [Chitinophagales bacterium]|nr:saccharopine dehydrogenase NADP-binding domain-containing protein [Chitinophagales bacterium]